MLKLLFGENTFELSQALNRLIQAADAVPERLNGEDLTTSDLPNLFMGGSLFAARRFIIIKDLSENSTVFEEILKYLDVDNPDTTIVLVEKKLDKRSKVYKHLKEAIDVQEFTELSSRDYFAVEKWLAAESAAMKLDLDKKVIQFLLDRVGLNQWQLQNALEKIQLSGDASLKNLENIIEPSAEQNVFAVFELAVKGERAKLLNALNNLELTAEPHQFFGLITSQMFNVAVLCLSGKSPAEIAADFGVNPYVLTKTQPLARRLTAPAAKKMLGMFQCADKNLKNSPLEPWLAIKTLLLRVTELTS